MSSEIEQLEQTLKNATIPHARIDALNALSTHIRSSDLARSLELAQEAEKLATVEKYEHGLAMALYNQSNHYRFAGDYAKALCVTLDAITAFEPLDDTKQQAILYQSLGLIYASIGDFSQALQAANQSLELYTSIDNTIGQMLTLTLVGVVHSDAGNHQLAIDFYKRSIDLHTILNNNSRKAITLNSCCVDYTHLKKFDLAESHGKQALDLFIQENDDFGASIARSSLGEVYLAKEDFSTAIDYFHEALSAFKASDARGDTLTEVLETQLNLGQSYFGLGDPSKALDYIQSTLAITDKQGNKHITMKAHHLLSQIYEQENDLSAALAHLKDYIALREVVLGAENQKHITNLMIIHKTQQAQADSNHQKKLREQEKERFTHLTQIKDDFLNHTTHDIKNPLAVIKNATYLLRKKMSQDDKTLSEYIEQIDFNAKKNLLLIEDILDIAQMEASSSHELEEVNLQNWLTPILNDFKPLADAKKISLTLTIAPLTQVYFAYKQYLSSVIENLVSNAIKYTQDGGTVDINIHENDNNLIIDITDNGFGIPEDAIPHLFDRFYRVGNHSGDIEGTGLGLSIVKLNVERHRGVIEIQSKLGLGTNITIYLPHLK